jgi:hypothetical protein
MILSHEIFSLRLSASQFCCRGLCVAICCLLSACASGLMGMDDPEPPRRTGQCKVITVNEYEALFSGLSAGQNFAIFSKLANDRQPKGPYELMTLRFDTVDQSGKWGVISLNGTQVDAADTFFETSPGVYENLTRLMQFPSCAGRITSIQQRLLFKK